MSARGSTNNRPLAVVFQTGDENDDFTRQLVELGFRWEKFEDPKEFLLKVNQEKPAICFIDVALEKKDMILVMIQTITKVLGRNPPMVALIEKGNKSLISRAIQFGVRAVVEKPCTTKDLAKIVSKLVTTAQITEIAAGGEATEEVDIKLPDVVDWYFTEISPILAGLADSLEDSYDLEYQVKFYYDRLLPYREQFVNMVNSMRKSDTKADLLQCVRLYGVSNVRILLLAIKVSELTKSNLLQWNPTTGRPTADPKRIIQFAAKAVEHYGDDSRYRSAAFNSGLVMDVMWILAEALGGRKAAVRKQIETSFSEGIKKADRVIAAAKDLKELSMDKHIVSAILMREAGKIAMALRHEEYLELRGRFDKKLVRPSLQHLLESRKYEVSHNILGSLICQGTPGLSPAYRAVLFYDYPFMLQVAKDESDQFALAAACNSVP